MTYTLFVVLFVGAVLFHGYQKGRRSLKENNESRKLCLARMEENISQYDLDLSGYEADGNTEREFSQAVKKIKIADSTGLKRL